MSKISIAAATPINSPSAAMAIHRMTGLALKSASDRLASGPLGVFYTTELFLNDHVEKDKEIRELLQKLTDLGVDLLIAEIGFDESWADVRDIRDRRISSSELLRILDDSKGKFH